MASLVLWGILVLLISVFALKGFIIIREAEEMVIERLGAYNRTLHKGVNFVWPIMESVREIEWKYITTGENGGTKVETKIISRIDLREIVYDFPEQSVITKDNVVMTINAILYFRVVTAKDACYSIKNLPDALEKLTQTTLRSNVGEMSLDDTLGSREQINTKLQQTLDSATDAWGVKVTRVELKNITPPSDIKFAMEAQMRAERTKRASILEAEGVKQSSILRAEGRKESEITLAAGEAQALELKSEAEAAAISRITKAVEASGGNPTEYLISMRYIENFKEMVSGKDNKIVYLPYQTMDVLGSIGGIQELMTPKTPNGKRLIHQ